MRHQPDIFLVCSALLLLAEFAQAEPRSVDLNSELEGASVVAEVTVLQYMDDRLWIQSVRDTFVRAEVPYSDYPGWNPKRFIQENWKNERRRTALWPPVGSTVLIVLNNAGTVSLFAEAVSEGYRFWSPMMTGSVALFECEPPAKVLEPFPAKGEFYKNKSWDGCLVPVSAVKWKDLQHP